MIQNITCIGAGNVGTHLSKKFYQSGYNIVEVYSRSEEKAAAVAKNTTARAVTNLHHLTEDTDMYIIAVSDQAIESVLNQIPQSGKLIVHTSGSTPITIFQDKVTDYGVLYPLQTFSKERPLDFSTIPFFIEANSRENEQKLRQVIQSLSEYIYHVNSEQRLALHVAAVFACNFTNHMYALAKDVLAQQSIPQEVLGPLIQETADKVREMDPLQAQTGPAVRNDQITMEKHLSYLESDAFKKKLYNFVSQHIQNRHYSK